MVEIFLLQILIDLDELIPAVQSVLKVSRKEVFFIEIAPTRVRSPRAVQ